MSSKDVPSPLRSDSSPKIEAALPTSESKSGIDPKTNEQMPISVAVEGSVANESGSAAMGVYSHPPHPPFPKDAIRIRVERVEEEKHSFGQDDENLDPRLFSFANCYFSIEWVKLKWAKPGSLRIYGEIKVEGPYDGKCVYIYRRHAHEAETISSEDADDEGSSLTLCGPNYGLCRVGYFTCNLFTEGGKPLVFGYFAAVLGKVLESGEVVRAAHQPVNEPVTTGLDLPGDLGELCIRYTRILFSMPATVEIFAISDSDEDKEISVCGTIDVIQTVEDCKEERETDMSMSSCLPLFETKSWEKSDHVQMRLGGVIPLPRSVFVVPMQTFASTLSGFKSSLTFEVDLELHRYVHAQEYVCRGSTTLVVEDDGKPKYCYIDAFPKRLRRRHRYRGRESGSGLVEADELKIKISVTPFHNWNSFQDEELLLH